MTISTIQIERETLDGQAGTAEARIDSTCADVAGEFDIESIELLAFNEDTQHDYTRREWALLEAAVQQYVFDDGSLVRQVYEDCLNEMNP